MKTILMVGLGGGIGSIFRYLTSLLVQKYYTGTLPFTTFAVNFLGCLIIGILAGLATRQNILSQDLKFLLITGFCGGYTTFSAFSYENLSLFQSGNTLTAFAYILGSVIICLGATWLGLFLTRI